MGKDTTKNLADQPVLKQVMKILPREQFDIVVRQCGSDRYYKSFFSLDQLVVMLFGIFSAAIRWAKYVMGCGLWEESSTTLGWTVHRPKARQETLYVTGTMKFSCGTTLR